MRGLSCRRRLIVGAFLAPLLAATAVAQETDAPELGVRLPPVPEACAYGPQDDEAIIVCGRRPPQGTYRIIPRQHDPDRVITQSWGAQVVQELEVARWGSQTVGPFGYMQHSAQRNAQWREERRQIRRREAYRGE